MFLLKIERKQRAAILAFLIPLLILASLLLAVTRPARADFYKYTDTSGTVHLSNTLNAVPPQYRANMQVVRDENRPQKDKAPPPRTYAPPRETPAAGPAEAPQEAPAEAQPTIPDRLSAHLSLRSPLVFLGAAIVLFFVVRKLTALLPSIMLARIIYLAFFLGVGVFAFKSYVDEIGSSYFTVKSRVLSLYEKANRREIPEAVKLPSPEKE